MTAQYYAIQTLLQYNIKEFSILVDDIESILLDRGWIIKSYDINSSDYIDIFKRMGVLDIAKYSPAFSIKTDNNMILFYRNNLSNAGKRFALPHELGHDIMGHFSKHGILGFQENGLLDDNQEREANEFALEFLAPICVLSVNRISTVEDISMFSLLDKKHCYEILTKIDNHNKYSNAEIELCKKFKAIKSPGKYKNIKLIISTSVLTIIIVTVLFIFLSQFYPSPISIQANEADDYESSPTPTLSISETSPSPSISVNQEKVGVTKSGIKYHDLNCSYIKDKPNIIYMTIDEAIKSGYQPCGKCKPK